MKPNSSTTSRADGSVERPDPVSELALILSAADVEDSSQSQSLAKSLIVAGYSKDNDISDVRFRETLITELTSLNLFVKNLAQEKLHSRYTVRKVSEEIHKRSTELRQG